MAAKNYHHGDLRTALVQAARTIMERDGLTALTLRACAREVGVSHAAPLHHFPTLADLLAAVAASGFDDFVRAIDDGSKDEPDPLERLVAMGVAYVAFAAANPALFRVMFGFDRPHVKSEALSNSMRAAWDQLYSANVAAGGEQRGVANSAFLWSLVHGHAMLVVAQSLPPIIDPESTLKSSLATLTAGIRAQGNA